jgi:transposase-like protein
MPRPLNRQVLGSLLVRRRRRWSREDAREVLDRLEASGLSVREFAAREGLDRQRVYSRETVWNRAETRFQRLSTSGIFAEQTSIKNPLSNSVPKRDP